MNTFKNLSLSVVLSASLLACATSNDPNQANFWSKQGQMACAVGGIIGGAIGLLLSDDDPTLGLALGASVGCGAGAGSNYLLDRERIKYKNKEELLAAETLRLKKLNSISRKINRETETTIAKDQAKIRRLREDIRSKRISESQARKELQKIDENINEMRGLVSSMENEKEHLKILLTKQELRNLILVKLKPR